MQQEEVGATPEKKKRKWWKGLLAVLLAVVFVGVGILAGTLVTYFSIDPRVRELQWILGVLDSQHYQDVDLDEVYGELYDAAMPDIFSHYYTEEEYQLEIEQSQGTNRGIGVTVTTDEEGFPLLYTVVENSPACLAGLESGMYLLGYSELDGELQTGTPSQIVSFIGSQEGEFCLYAGFSSDGSDAERYVLAREVYHAAYCVYRDSESSYALRTTQSGVAFTETGEPLEGLDDATAYIRLDGFDGLCAWEFSQCMEIMRENSRTNLILDLRNNGGGYMSDFQSIVSYFLKDSSQERPLVAYVQYRDGSRRNFSASSNQYAQYFTSQSKITVLANEGSASASECLIGAMIDYGAITYSDVYLHKFEGESDCSTYGKGVMQSTFRSPQGGAMMLTVARIYWPVSGNCIHGVGIRESDGANGIVAPYLPGATDSMLQTVVARVCN